MSELNNLQTLSLLENQIININPLKKLNNLKKLSLDLNQISDVSALSELTNLKSLSLANNKINDISALKKFANLKVLSLHNYEGFDFDIGDPLNILDFMKSHDIYTNQISDSDQGKRMS
ncbi:leucine-rich repeat domain-containing protein [Clostridium thailandense]|uniref:leucine-rich repeat domain-containing protein n=1 Tax=Clostridium thailandense TaxID=2794346 RepID=UPI003989B687